MCRTDGMCRSLGWYDVLLELRRSQGGLRHHEIEARLLLARPNVSRLVERLERAGYVEQRKAAEDGRGQLVTITDAGRELLARMWPAYGAAIERHMGERLGGDAEADILAALLTKLLGPQEGRGP